MEQRELEFLLYLGDTNSIIKWLTDEGCETQKEAIEKLKPLVNKNRSDILNQVAQNNEGASAGGMVNVINKVLDKFRH